MAAPEPEKIIIAGEELPEALHAAWHRLQRAWLEGAIAIAQQQALALAEEAAAPPLEVAS